MLSGHVQILTELWWVLAHIGLVKFHVNLAAHAISVKLFISLCSIE